MIGTSCPHGMNLSKELGDLHFCIGREQARPKSQEDIEELCVYDLLERLRYEGQLQQWECSLFSRGVLSVVEQMLEGLTVIQWCW